MHRCVAINTVNFKTLSVLQKETPYPLVVTPGFPFPSPWKPLIYFIFLWICLFWTFCIGRIVSFLIFCDLFHLTQHFKNLCLSQHVSVIDSFSLPNNIPLWQHTTSYLSFNRNVDDSYFLAILHNAVMKIPARVFARTCFYFSWLHVEVKLLSHIIAF